MADDVRTAVARRDAALARTRRVTGLGVLLGLGATFVVSAVAAGSTHARKAVVHVIRPRHPAAAPLVAPAPPLVSAGSEESPAAPSSPSTAAPAPAPAATAAPPVVVSGGS